MSAITVPGPIGIPFARLARAELRKLTDTRASRWLLAAIATATPVVVAVMLVVASPRDLLNQAQGPLYTPGRQITGTGWLPLLVASSIWILLPLATGAVRALRGEIKSA
jgi:hypothetical protein